jgi:hypothetical protein
MPALAKEREQYFISRIRGLIALDHRIRNDEIGQRLAVDGIELERHYVGKLVKKIYAERARRMDTITLNHALVAFAETMEEIVRRARDIADNPMSERLEVLAALREIRSAHNDMFTKLFDAGVFERKLGTLDATIRNTPLPEEKKQTIRDVFTNWGLLTAPKEDVRPAEPTGNP